MTSTVDTIQNLDDLKATLQASELRKGDDLMSFVIRALPAEALDLVAFHPDYRKAAQEVYDVKINTTAKGKR